MLLPGDTLAQEETERSDSAVRYLQVRPAGDPARHRLLAAEAEEADPEVWPEEAAWG